MTLEDQATEREEKDREIALMNKKYELPKTGLCHWCGEQTIGSHCSPECREDWENQQRFNR